MESVSPLRKKNTNNRSRSRSRSKEHHAKKSTSKVPIEPKAKYEEEKKHGSSLEDNELERKFKDFEAEIHAIDPSNKSEKNETKKQKTFETTENLILLYNKRIYVEGFPVEELENKDQGAKIKEDFKDLFKENKEVVVMTPSKKEGKPLLLIDFETRESLDSAIKIFENYDQDGIKLKIFETLSSDETYTKQVIEIVPKSNPPKSEKEPNVILNDNTKEVEDPPKVEDSEIIIKNPENETQVQPDLATDYQNQAMQYYPQQVQVPEDPNFMALQQNGYPYMNYDQQYLYSLKQQSDATAGYLNQQYPQYQYSAEGYYQQQSIAIADLTNAQTYANAEAYKANTFPANPAEYGFNLNSLNLQMTENPNAFSMMPKILPEANVFIKNLNPITTTKDLENAFRVYGNILSSKIATDYYGQSLAYGYIQFELKEGADACIQQANNAVFQDMIISVQPFNSKLNKIDGRNNLYIKNLPTYLNDDQLNQKIMEIFSKFGPITSSVVKLDRSLNRPFAFVCYENHIYADMAFKALHDTDPFRSGNRLYISWAEKKIDRVKRLTELHTSQQNLQQNNFGMMGMGVGGGGGAYYQNSNSNGGSNYKNYQGRGNNS